MMVSKKKAKHGAKGLGVESETQPSTPPLPDMKSSQLHAMKKRTRGVRNGSTDN